MSQPSRALWLTPVIPATLETEMGRTSVGAQLRQKVPRTPSQQEQPWVWCFTSVIPAGWEVQTDGVRAGLSTKQEDPISKITKAKKKNKTKQKGGTGGVAQPKASSSNPSATKTKNPKDLRTKQTLQTQPWIQAELERKWVCWGPSHTTSPLLWTLLGPWSLCGVPSLGLSAELSAGVARQVVTSVHLGPAVPAA
jgi:hypothetical protein